MADRLTQVLSKANDAEKIEIEILQQAIEESIRECGQNFTVSKKRKWDAAREGLSAVVDRLYTKYFDDVPSFPNLYAVSKYLSENGYKIKKSKIYSDRKKGLIIVQPDGRVYQTDVTSYAATLEKIHDRAGKLEEQTEQKQKAEIKRIKEQTKSIIFEREIKQGKYILRTAVETAQAIKAGAFEAGLKHIFQTNFGEFLEVVDGNPNKIQAGINFWFQAIDKLFNELASLKEIYVSVNNNEKPIKSNNN